MDSAILSNLANLDEADLRKKQESSGDQNVANGTLNAQTTSLLERRLDKLLLDSNCELTNLSAAKTMGGNDPLDRSLTSSSSDNISKPMDAATDNTGSQNGTRLTKHDSEVSSPASDSLRYTNTEKMTTDHISTPNKLSDQEPSSPASVVYYGVCRPPTATLEDDDLVGVYTDKKEALRAVKKYKGARFKAFKTQGDATLFASLLPDETCNSPSGTSGSSAAVSAVKDSDTSFDTNGASGEKPSPFRTPKPQDLVKLRKAIESDGLEYVEQTVWSNPRYLVSSGDTPAILQEGSRYNALHVAAKFKRFAMVKLVLDIIENQEFMQLLYSDDTEETCLQRIDFLMDLYLNTPDKGLCETPLHFAAKFGCAKIVEILTSYPACDRERRNKYGQTAKDVVCSRCPNNGSPDLRAEIEMYLQERYYVPVLRAEDNSIQPVVGDPWSPVEVKQKTLDTSASQPYQLPMSVKAYAGPMSPQQAQEFHKRLKTPTRHRRRALEMCAKSKEIRLSDTEKGLERVGREIAKDMRVLWTEYWSFLKSFCDVSKPEGLNKLESYLRSKFNELMAKECNRSFDSESNDIFLEDKEVSKMNLLDLSDKVAMNTSNNSSGLGSLCEALDRLQLNSSICSSGSGDSPRLTATSEQNLFASPHSGQSSNGIVATDYKNTNGTPRAMNVASFLERTCQVVASQIYTEVCRFADAQHEYWALSDLPHRMFTKSLLPPVECLQNIVSNLRLCDQLKGSDFKIIHFSVTRKVCEAIEEDDNVFARDFIEKISSIPEQTAECFSEHSDLSDDDGTTGQTTSKWGHRRQRNHRRKRRLSTMMQQHLRCILNIMMQILKLPKLTKETKPIECYCSWFAYHPEGMYAPASPGSKLINDQLHSPKTVDVQGSELGHTTSAPIFCVSRELSRAEIGDGSDFSVSPAKSDGSVYYTPPSSHCSSGSEMESAEEGPAVFVEGLYPTKLDLDILRAIENVQIDAVQHPHIYRWKNTITSYPTEVIESWPSPSCPRARRNTASLSSSSPSSTATRQSYVSDSPLGSRGRPLSSTPILLPSTRNESHDLRTSLLKAFNTSKSSAD